MSVLEKFDPEIAQIIRSETERQEYRLELIASENYVSEAVLEAAGSVLTNKYAEGLPGKRYYGGCEFVDIAEDIARDRAKELFGCEAVICVSNRGMPQSCVAARKPSIPTRPSRVVFIRG